MTKRCTDQQVVDFLLETGWNEEDAIDYKWDDLFEYQQKIVLEYYG